MFSLGPTVPSSSEPNKLPSWVWNASYTFQNTAQKTRFCICLPRELTLHTGLQMEHEASFRRRIDIEQLPLFQRLIACDTTSSNPPHTPYFVLGWAEGVPPKWTDSTPAEDGYGKKILYAIAQSNMDLLRIRIEDNSQWGSITESHVRDTRSNN